MIKILRVFYGFLLRRKKIALAFFILIILGPAFHSIVPYFYKLFVDSITNFNIDNLPKILIIYLIVRFLALLFDVGARQVGDLLLMDGGVNARVTVFKHIHDLDFAFHTEKSTGSLISIIKRGDGAFYSLYDSIHFRIIDVFVGFIVMLFFFSTIGIQIAILAIVSLIISIIIASPLVKYNIKKRKVFNDSEDNISAIIVDNMINFETVKLFAKESWEQKRLDKAFISWRKAFWGYTTTFRFIDLIMGSLINITLFLILFYTIFLVQKTQMSVGEFVLVVGFLGSFSPRVWELIWSIRDIAKHYTDIERYSGVLENVIKIKDPEKPVKVSSVDGEIKFENVTFKYEKRQSPAVKNINLHFRQGQSIALVGRSGVGKTTLVKLLMRFYDVTNGKITIDGIDIRKFTKSQLRSFIGVVPQEPILFDNSIAYNIAYGKEKASLDEIKAAARLANIESFIEILPEKYETRVGERGIKLSGGQKQRMAIARMILSDPDIIIFDEATSQLDTESEMLIQDAIWKAAKNKTMIIIAHRLSTVVRADKIVLMEKGKVKEVGSHRELIAKKKGLYKRFWNLQIRS